MREHPYGAPELDAPQLRRRANKLAIASVVLAVLGLSWPGSLLGLMAGSVVSEALRLGWLGPLLGLIFGVVAHQEI